MNIYSSLSGRLRTQHESIKQIISKIDPDMLHYRPIPDKWNIQENIAHLAKYQPLFTERVGRILVENNPEFAIYSAENDPEFELWCSIDTFTLLKQLDYERTLLVKLVTKLSSEQLERTGTHPKFGKLPISQWIEFFVLHEAHHLFTIFKLSNSVNS